MSDRAVDPQRVGSDHCNVVGRVPELPQRRAGLMVNVATVARAHGHAAGGLRLRALSDDPGAGRRGQQHGRRRRQCVRGADAAAATAADADAAADAAAAASVRHAAAAGGAVPVAAGRAGRAGHAAAADAAPTLHALPGHGPRYYAVALAPQTLAPVDGQIPAVQLDVRHRPGRRAAVVGRPALVAAAQRRCGVPQVPVMVRYQRRGAVLSGQHGFAGRRAADRPGRRPGTGRGPYDRRRTLDQQRSGLLVATVTAVRHRLRHFAACFDHL